MAFKTKPEKRKAKGSDVLNDIINVKDQQKSEQKTQAANNPCDLENDVDVKCKAIIRS